MRNLPPAGRAAGGVTGCPFRSTMPPMIAAAPLKMSAKNWSMSIASFCAVMKSRMSGNEVWEYHSGCDGSAGTVYSPVSSCEIGREQPEDPSAVAVSRHLERLPNVSVGRVLRGRWGVNGRREVTFPDEGGEVATREGVRRVMPARGVLEFETEFFDQRSIKRSISRFVRSRVTAWLSVRSMNLLL